MFLKLNFLLLLLLINLFTFSTTETSQKEGEGSETDEIDKKEVNPDKVVLLSSEGEVAKKEEKDEESPNRIEINAEIKLEEEEDGETVEGEEKKSKITARFIVLGSDGETKEKKEFNVISLEDLLDDAENKSSKEENKIEEEQIEENEVYGFEEFIPEKNKISNNLQIDTLYNNALNILSKKRWSVISQNDIRKAYSDLEEASKLGLNDAKKILAFSYLFGDYRWSINEALQIFEQLAEETGSADAHLGLGFLHTTGVGMKEGPNPGLGFLHYTFAALGGNPLAQMALGYRYGHGIGVKQDCETALIWYKKVANKVAKKVKLTGMPSVQRIRIPDELVFIFYIKKIIYLKKESSSIAGTLLDSNVFSYYKYLAETGDTQAVIGLAQLYLTGGKGVPMDLEAANKYFQIAAEAGSAQANGYLGRMYLEGTTATPQNNDTAFDYFKKAADKGNSIGQAGLGMMFLYGYGVKSDPQKAIKLFALAAEQGLLLLLFLKKVIFKGSPDAQLHLGQMYYQGLGVKRFLLFKFEKYFLRDFKQALKHFQLASQSGHILAIYNLAQMHSKGTGVLRNCKFAVALYKNVAERGRWTERFMDAYIKFQSNSIDEAAFRYLFLAELGYEAAQTNFAYLIDSQDGTGKNEKFVLFSKEEAYRRAYINWQRAANQDYPIARVKLGDYKYYGLGSETDLQEAAEHYKIAAQTHQNAQAMFNLGYMHENGLGVTKDLFLAKRYYDLAAETSTEAVWPVTLALIKLKIEFFRDYLTMNYAQKTISLKFLDNLLGPDWDLYLMSLAFGLVVWLGICYFRNRFARL
ncbi:hypothetical protein Mgra_00005923 [Meloidogyne graminicola]|uniref:Uncharacterized protein n=1 Tax=Meloidogyne graminicola TaxID=189291 RepID=A0A8S9ZN00_9BILA|nr:hypothetical protein Mgra_00005923 [Meloidogyne graminicola]